MEDKKRVTISWLDFIVPQGGIFLKDSVHLKENQHHILHTLSHNNAGWKCVKYNTAAHNNYRQTSMKTRPEVPSAGQPV